jgi:outer membrane immunogenic protein
MRRFGVALLASLSLVSAAAAAPVVVLPYNWTGLYAGLNIGYSWGDQDISINPAAGSTSLDLDGIIGGGQIGYNWQMNQLVLGIEADFQGSGQKDDGALNIGSTFLPNLTFNDKLQWFGTVRGRLGFAQDRWLFYVTGGWAYGHASISGTSTVPVSAFSGSNFYSGWTVGGGLEWAFMSNWSAKIEYLYIDFGDGPSMALPPSAFTVVAGKLTDNILRVGVNYHF